MKRKKRLVISVITIPVVVIVILMVSLILSSNSNSNTKNKVYTRSDIVKLTGTAVVSDKDEIYDTEYTSYYSINCYKNPQNNYQQLEYMLFDSPETARKVFDQIKSGRYESLRTETPDFVSGREDYCDVFYYSFYLLRGNMLVTSALSVGAYFIDLNEKAKNAAKEAEDAERSKKFNKLEKWLINEVMI
jgi:hypothetical protein